MPLVPGIPINYFVRKKFGINFINLFICIIEFIYIYNVALFRGAFINENILTSVNSY